MSSLSNKPFYNKEFQKDTVNKAYAKTYEYRSYSPDEVSAFNAVNLINLVVYMSEKSISYQSGRIVLKSHPWIYVYPEGFYDIKSRKCYNAINGLKLFFDLSFPQACFLISRYYNGDAFFLTDHYVKERYPLAYNSSLSLDYNLNDALKDNLLYQQGNNSLKMVFSVLHNRMCIDRETIKKFLSEGKIMVNKYFDLCFLEYENDNVITVTKKLQRQNHIATEIETVKRNTTFTWIDKAKCSYYNVYVFEDVYEIMSYLTLINKGLVPPLESNSVMLSLNGKSFSALESYLYENKKIKAVYACLSNTMQFADAIKDIPFDGDKVINMQYILQDYTAEHGLVETWNDILLAEKAKNK